jgi:hypothetical protein
MNVKRMLITGMILTVLFILMQFLVHGVMLNDIYMQTASIWRPETEMQSLIYMMFIGETIFAFFFAIIFAAGYDASKPGLGQGLRFGLLIACLLAPFSSLSWYVILPIPATLAQYWFMSDFVVMTLLGVAAGLIYKKS